MDERIRALFKEQPDKGLELVMKQYMGLCWSIVYNQLQGAGTKEDTVDKKVQRGLVKLRGVLEGGQPV